VLEQLRKPFPASLVKKNQNGMDYVSIDGYINRLLDVLGFEYSFIIRGSSLQLLDEDMTTSTGKRQYLATVTAELQIMYEPGSISVRSGTGADVSFDPDKAIKTAQAEALKKAAHQFGIALELWDEEHRKDLDVARRAAGGSEQALKKAVFDRAKEKLGKKRPTLKQVAEAFGVEEGDLSDKGKLEKILKDEGIL
jgi:hypothetical protein